MAKDDRQQDRRSSPPSDSSGATRRQILLAGAGLLSVWSGIQPSVAAKGLDISNRYSPRDRRRPRRPQTRYIVLHTTEGGESSSLRKLRRRGEAHYLVTRKGRVYRIISKSKIATHAGRSMWESRTNLDNMALGIEVVGYHNKDITSAQYRALKELLRQLQSVYKIPDASVLTHSMVAYGRPNRFHHYNHRGRKRCGMIFARHDVRTRLGLEAKPIKDRDVAAGRLKVGDPELYAFLFARPPVLRTASRGQVLPDDSDRITPGRTAWDIARERYNSAETRYVFPNGNEAGGDQIHDWGRLPIGTRVMTVENDDDEEAFEGFVEVKSDGVSASQLAGDVFDTSTTIYFLPDGRIRTGDELRKRASTRRLLKALPRGTRLLVGYIYGGRIQRRRPAARIAGVKWNYPSTFYRLPDGRILSGDEIDDSSIPERTLIFYQS